MNNDKNSSVMISTVPATASSTSNSIAAAVANEEMEMRKRKNRLEQNRVSARESRKRKKMMIEDLQRSVALLSNENRLLNQQHQLLKHQLAQVVSGWIVVDWMLFFLFGLFEELIFWFICLFCVIMRLIVFNVNII